MHFTTSKVSRLARPAVVLATATFLAGCTSTNVSEAPRTAVEQLLFSTATDNALAEVHLPEIEGQRVFVDGRYLASYDQSYVLGSIRALLSENGALLQAMPEEADVIVEPRSGALGSDYSHSLFGIPSIPLIIPGAGTVRTPELSLYSSENNDAVSKIALLAYRTDGSLLFSTDPLIGKSHFHQYKVLLLVNINFTDIPAREDY